VWFGRWVLVFRVFFFFFFTVKVQNLSFDFILFELRKPNLLDTES